MAIIVRDWVSGALVHFGDLRFIVNPESGLERICSSDCSVDTASSDSVIGSLRGLRLEAGEADASAHT